jgi:hypothetical protein
MSLEGEGKLFSCAGNYFEVVSKNEPGTAIALYIIFHLRTSPAYSTQILLNEKTGNSSSGFFLRC